MKKVKSSNASSKTAATKKKALSKLEVINIIREELGALGFDNYDFKYVHLANEDDDKNKCCFRLRGIKHWLFYIWVLEEDDDKYTVTFCGDNNNDLGMFIQSYERVFSSIVIPRNLDKEHLYLIQDIITNSIHRDLMHLRKSRLAVEYCLGYSQKGFIPWIFSIIWCRLVSNPFMEKIYYPFLLKVGTFIVANWYRFRYFKHVNSVEIIDNHDGFYYPRYELIFAVNEETPEEVKQVLDDIEFKWSNIGTRVDVDQV